LGTEPILIQILSSPTFDQGRFGSGKYPVGGKELIEIVNRNAVDAKTTGNFDGGLTFVKCGKNLLSNFFQV
jgi:hypothetical protein